MQARTVLVDPDKLNIEDERGIRRDVRRRAVLAIPVRGRARELRFLADAHLHHPLVPALDHLADADRELERRLEEACARMEHRIVRDEKQSVDGLRNLPRELSNVVPSVSFPV